MKMHKAYPPGGHYLDHYHWNKRSSHWQPSCHWLHRRLLEWQPWVHPVTSSLSIWRPFGFSDLVAHFQVHDDVIKWKHFLRYWPFARGIHRAPVNSPHKGHWRGALMFSLICAWINGWVNTGEAGDLRCHRAHYDVIAMSKSMQLVWQSCTHLKSTVDHPQIAGFVLNYIYSNTTVLQVT